MMKKWQVNWIFEEFYTFYCAKEVNHCSSVNKIKQSWEIAFEREKD